MYKVGSPVLGIRMLEKAKARFVAKWGANLMQEGQDDNFTLAIGDFSTVLPLPAALLLCILTNVMESLDRSE